MGRPTDKKPRRTIQTMADFEAAYVPKGIQISRSDSLPDKRPTPDLVSEALRSFRQSLR
jgi:hypothetical protein